MVEGVWLMAFLSVVSCKRFTRYGRSHCLLKPLVRGCRAVHGLLEMFEYSLSSTASSPAGQNSVSEEPVRSSLMSSTQKGQAAKCRLDIGSWGKTIQQPLLNCIMIRCHLLLKGRKWVTWCFLFSRL